MLIRLFLATVVKIMRYILQPWIISRTIAERFILTGIEDGSQRPQVPTQIHFGSLNIVIYDKMAKISR